MEEKDNSLSLTGKIVRTEKEFQEAVERYINDQLGALPHFSMVEGETAFSKLGLFLKGYMVCRASDCPYAEACPIMRSLAGKPEEQEKLRHSECRFEMLNAARLVTGLIKKLEIEDDNLVDLGYVAQIAMNKMILDRIGMDLGVNGMWQTNPGLIDSRNSTVYHRKEVNELLKFRSQFEKGMDDAINKLNASRKDKVKGTFRKDSMDELKNLISGFTKDSGGAVIEDIIEGELSG